MSIEKFTRIAKSISANAVLYPASINSRRPVIDPEGHDHIAMIPGLEIDSLFAPGGADRDGEIVTVNAGNHVYRIVA